MAYLMKLLGVIVSCTVFMNCSNKAMVYENNLPIVSVKDIDIYSAITDIYDSEMYNYDWSRSVFVIKTIESKGECIVKVSIFYKNNFNWYLRMNREYVLGFLDYKGLETVILGKDPCELFDKSKESKSAQFINGKLIKEKITLEDKLVIFEPTVWVFYVQKDKLILKDKGMIGI